MGTETPLLPKTARVLLVVEQPVLAGVIQLALTHGPYMLQVAATGAEALAALDTWRPHLLLLDMDLLDGVLLERVAARESRTDPLPVIALTRRGDLATKLAAFDKGADDILTVPFSPEELVARSLAVMRRTYRGEFPFKPELRLGELEIDILNRCVRVGGHDLHLTALDQSLLYLLAANAGRVVTRDEILDHLWGTDFIAESNVVDRHVRNLRAKLQNNWRRPRYIATVHGRGYRFVPVSSDQSSAPHFG
ncbi:MAG TPA: response regulator transcription factor [Thermomicrobiales bacterium]|nr:response regulator transcription factor [Thermomicrobiales bacterium]